MDVLLVGCIAGLVYGGLRTGLVHRLNRPGLMALAFVLGAYLREPIGGIVTSFFPNIPTDYAGLVGYTVAFPVILGPAAHLIAHPFVKGRHLGGVSHPRGSAPRRDLRGHRGRPDHLGRGGHPGHVLRHERCLEGTRRG